MYEITDVITAASANGGRDLDENEVAQAEAILANLRTVPSTGKPELTPAQLASLVKGMTVRGFTSLEEAVQASGTSPAQYLFNVVDWMRATQRESTSEQMRGMPVTERQFSMLVALSTIAKQQDKDKVVEFLDRVLEGCVDPDLATFVPHLADRLVASKAINHAKRSLGLDRTSNSDIFALVGVEVSETEAVIAQAVAGEVHTTDDEF
jgi:hypothetical protein